MNANKKKPIIKQKTFCSNSSIPDSNQKKGNPEGLFVHSEVQFGGKQV